MIAEAFVDTNLFVYLFSRAAKESDRRMKVAALVESISSGISSQVVQEFYVTVTRKIKIPIPISEARRLVDWLGQFPCVKY